MKDKIGLYYTPITPNTPIRGCVKVVQNLIAGLKQLDISVEFNKNLPLTGCLQGVPELHKGQVPANALIGPEILVFANDYPNLWNKYKYWTQPSLWVIDNLKIQPLCKNTKFYVWPVGVNEEMFNPDNRDLKYDCFVYYKDVNHTTPIKYLKFTEDELKRRNMKYKILKYGSYNESELIQATKDCKFGIIISGTESQGLAYMECLSSNVPLFVFNQNYLTFRGRKYTVETNISSAPYFDERCGMITNTYDFNKFDEFLNNIDKYAPREYILENHTLKKGAEKYYNILKEINNVQ